jgi:hypothetical protein
VKKNNLTTGNGRLGQMKELDLFTEDDSVEPIDIEKIIEPVTDADDLSLSPRRCGHCGSLIEKGRGGACSNVACYADLCDACLINHEHIQYY